MDLSGNTGLQAALAAHRGGDLAAAIRGYREFLALAPGSFEALSLLGAALLDIGDPAGALEACDLANARNAGVPEVWYNRANALRRLQRREESVRSYEQALALRPEYPAALNNLADLLRELKRPERALDCLERALGANPGFANAWNSRGLVLLDVKRGAEAVASFERALEAAPDRVEALYNRGNALMELERYPEAAESFERLAAAAPEFMYLDGQRLGARLQSCDWREYAEAVERVQSGVAAGARTDFPFSFLCVSASAHLQLQCARTYARDQCPEVAGVQRPPRFGHTRIRVAYVSGDFGRHAVSRLLAGVFEAHDTARFETVAVSWGRRGDGAIRARLERSFAHFIDVTEVDDAAVAARLRELEIDIAVDLTGHTRDHRGGIFAHRAAPVQVNFLGLPATMGADYMDYLIADRHVVPEATEGAYAERVALLPDTFQPNDARRATVQLAPRAAFGLPEKGVVLCSFNACAKLNPPLFDIWMRVLAASDAVLWLLATHEAVERNLRREAAMRGIDPARLIFAGRLDYARHLGRYRHADLFLDSLPFNGGATASDALGAGVPVLSCAGEAFASRMSASLLRCLELPDLVAESPAAYEAAATRLARDPGELFRLRRILEQRRRDHVFFDTVRYTRHLEAAYHIMWARREAGEPAARFAVGRLPAQS